MNKMKFLSIVALSIVSLFSCNDNHLDDLAVETPIEKTKSANDGFGDICGHGYDATYDNSDVTYAKLPVLDFKRLHNEKPNYITVDKYNYSHAKITSGKNSIEYTQKINNESKAGLSLANKKIQLFTSTLSSKFSKNFVYESHRSYASYLEAFPKKRIYIAFDDILRNYTTELFKERLQKWSADRIIAEYGTHVVTGIYLGASFECYFESIASQYDKSTVVEAGLAFNIKKIFDLSTTTNTETHYVNSNIESKLFYKVKGGSPNLISEGVVDLSQNVKISIDAWKQSISESNETFIYFDPNGLIPIYEFISDPVKKGELENAFYKYLNTRQIKEIETGRNKLKAGEHLSKGQKLDSSNRIYSLEFQYDGNIVLYKKTTTPATALWSTRTHKTNATSFYLQTDGNLVLSDPNWAVKWSSNTHRAGNDCVLYLQDDGNLVLYDRYGAAVWETRTYNK